MADGQKVWAFKTGGAVESSPLVLEGKVFVGSSDATLYALEAASGKLLWKYETGEKILGGPNWVLGAPASLPASLPHAKDAGQAVGHPGDGGVGRDAGAPRTRILVGSYDFKLHCVEAATGKAAWTYESGNYINGSPAVADGQTVFGGCDALLHVISLADGQQVKEIEAGAYVAGSVAIADHCAYFGHFDNAFQCVDLAKGTNLWTFTDRPFPYFSSPAIAKDRVVFGGRDKLVHCLKRVDGGTLL